MEQRRNTRQRQMVLDLVRAHADHPTADLIFLEVRALDNKISRSTVYRNLNLLASGGDILHVKVPSADRFDRRLEFHDHLLCTRCGALCDAPLRYQAELDRTLAEQTGYAVSRHRTIYEGICPSCRTLPQEGSSPAAVAAHLHG